MSPIVNKQPRPDGFVSVNELASMLLDLQNHARMYFGGELRPRGNIPDDERFIIRVDGNPEN